MYKRQTEYFRVDGGAERNIFSKDSEHGDNISAYFGGGNNMRILYNGSHGFISQNVGGDLRLVQNVDDGDIKFQADDGSGGLATYVQLDGSEVSTKILTQKVIMSNLPTSDPSNAGQLYNDSGVLKVSAG